MKMLYITQATVNWARTILECEYIMGHTSLKVRVLVAMSANMFSALDTRCVEIILGSINV